MASMDQTSLIFVQSYLEVTPDSYDWIKVLLYRYWVPAFRLLIYIKVRFGIASIVTVVLVFSIILLGQL